MGSPFCGGSKPAVWQFWQTVHHLLIVMIVDRAKGSGVVIPTEVEGCGFPYLARLCGNSAREVKISS